MVMGRRVASVVTAPPPEDDAPAMPLETRPLTASDLPALQAVMVGTPGYFEAIGAAQPDPQGHTEAQAVLEDLPPGKSAHDKIVLGLWLDGALVGCADLVIGYPRPEVAFVGLLLVAEELQGCGLGTVAFAELARRAQDRGCERMRLGVAQGHTQAEHFWTRRGFSATGEVGRDLTGHSPRDILLFERPLRRATARA
jgi:GNAT superfamily N-acetyltransferase